MLRPFSIQRLVVIFLFHSCLVSAGDIPVLKLSLADVVQKTLATSPRYQAELSRQKAQVEHSKSQMALMFPSLTFEASYRYQTEVPLFSPIPNGPKTPFGDHKNYSYGPALNWMVWDSGGHYYQWKSAQAQALAQQKNAQALERELVLSARLAYFQVRLALEQSRALSESMTLATEQYRDISAQQKVGTLSRMDLLSAHDDLLARRRELIQARMALAAGLRELFSLAGLGQNLDPTMPFLSISSSSWPSPIDRPTLLVDAEPISVLMESLSAAEKGTFGPLLPRIEALRQSIEAAERMSEGLKSQHGPSVQLTAKMSRDYPQGPVLESVDQQSVAVMARLPLFEFKRVVNEVDAQKAQIDALSQDREQFILDLKKKWDQAHQQLLGYRSERELNQISAQESETLSQLVYESYRVGRSTYLEVERANLRALTADVRLIQTDIQILIQLATIESLSI